MKTKRQTPESQELMLQLTRELVDRDLDRIIGKHLQERTEKRKQEAENTIVEKYIDNEKPE
ncbi:MAG: hypothetical protein LBP87_15815 [Planctomycetaceae bacterium]|jgi:hypothetical protein|nr:hypothetical protein [Planctomycetaceae bacterium]